MTLEYHRKTMVYAWFMHGFDSCWNNIGVDWPTWRTEKVQLMWKPDPKESLGLGPVRAMRCSLCSRLWCCGPLIAKQKDCYCAYVNDRFVYTFEYFVCAWGMPMLENTALYAFVCSFASYTFISAMSVY